MTVRGACHCGSIQFEVVLVDGLNTARRCNCSICRMRGAVAVSALTEDLTITSGVDKLTSLSVQHHGGKTLFLFDMWHLHSSPASLEPARIWRQRRLPGGPVTIQYRGSIKY